VTVPVRAYGFNGLIRFERDHPLKLDGPVPLSTSGLTTIYTAPSTYDPTRRTTLTATLSDASTEAGGGYHASPSTGGFPG
jgi:hypothetical protein